MTNTERTPILEVFKREHKGAPNTSEPERTILYYWRLRDEEGKIFAESPSGHKRKKDAIHHAEDAQSLMANARVEVIA